MIHELKIENTATYFLPDNDKNSLTFALIEFR